MNGVPMPKSNAVIVCDCNAKVKREMLQIFAAYVDKGKFNRMCPKCGMYFRYEKDGKPVVRKSKDDPERCTRLVE